MKKSKTLVMFLLLINPLFTKAENIISYSANLGGLKIAEIIYSIDLQENNWNIKTDIKASGLVDKFVSFTFKAESKGLLDDGKLKPEIYNFYYEIKNKNKSREASIKYDDGIPISLKANPPYRGSDILSKDDLFKYGSNSSDPNSAFVVSGIYKNPCLESSRSFDGVRSYEIKMSERTKKGKLIINENKYEIILCKGSFNPIVGYEESDFLETASEKNSIAYWYKYFDKEKMWVPLKFTIDTPIGALVVKANKITNNNKNKE